MLALQAEADTSVIAKLLLRDPEDIDLVELCRDRGVTGAEVWFSDLSVLAVATKSGLPLSTYTLDEVHCDGLSDEKALNDPESVWGKLRTAGIRAIMTDHPAALLSFLDGKKNI